MRLENEHLGNIDQYRVTREVPLPYSYDDHSHDSDGDEDDATTGDRSCHTRALSGGRYEMEDCRRVAFNDLSR